MEKSHDLTQAEQQEVRNAEVARESLRYENRRVVPVELLRNPQSAKFQAALEETFKKFEAMSDEELESVVAAHMTQQEAQGTQAWDERAAFESTLAPSLSRETFVDEEGDTIYCDTWVQGASIGWRRRAALATQPAVLPTDPANWPLKVGADEFISQQADWPDTDPADFMHDALYEMIRVLTQPAVRGAEHDQ